MVFESKLAHKAVEDRLDPLADAPEFPKPRLLVLAVGPQEMRAEVLGEEPLEVTSGEDLGGEDDLPVRDQMVVVVQQGLR